MSTDASKERRSDARLHTGVSYHGRHHKAPTTHKRIRKTTLIPDPAQATRHSKTRTNPTSTTTVPRA
eukprot:8823712-Alexandrium_andersonii.AAC.1